jgi:hypothetical protein
MADVHMNGPAAVAPGGLRWCVICLAAVKYRHWKATKAERDAGAAAKGGQVVIAWDERHGAGLRVGHYRAICADAPALGLVPLCWDHVAGVDDSPSPLANGAGLPPGLLKGRG